MGSYGLSLLIAIFFFLLVGPGQACGKEVIKVGASVSMTGPFSQEVGPFKRLFQAWEEQVNSSGGLRVGQKQMRLETIVYDDRSDPQTAKTVYERLVQKDLVHVLLGPYSSPLTFAASIPAEERQVPFIAICGNSSKIYSRKFRWLLGILDLAPNYTRHYWEMIRAENKIRSVAFVVEDSMHPKGVYEGSRALAESGGVRTVFEEILAPDTQDFSGLIYRIKRADPHLVFVSGNLPFAINFMKQAREKALEPMEFHCIHHSGIFRKALGDFSEGVTGQMYWVEAMKTSGRDEFMALLQRSNIDPYDYPWAVTYYVAFQILSQALSKANSLQNEHILEALRDGHYSTICGENRFTERGSGLLNPMPAQIQAGEYQIVWPRELATSVHRYRR